MFGVVPPISEQVISGDWFFSVANMGSYTQAYWNAGNEEVSKHYSPCLLLLLPLLRLMTMQDIGESFSMWQAMLRS